MRRPLAPLVLALALLALGCQGAYRDKGNFVPHPAEVIADGGAGVRTLASVIGIRNPDKEAGLPRSVEVRLRIENRGEEALTFDPATLRLTSGDLTPFGAAITDPASAVDLPPGRPVTVTANFPFPEGVKENRVDLNGLNLGWAIGTERQSVTFTRRLTPEERYYRDRGPHFGVGIGVGTVID